MLGSVVPSRRMTAINPKLVTTLILTLAGVPFGERPVSKRRASIRTSLTLQEDS